MRAGERREQTLSRKVREAILAFHMTRTLPKDEILALYLNETYFGNLIGFPTFEVEASATANCGGATSACGLWPIAFDFAMWGGVQCGQSLSVWDADYAKQDISCEIGGVPREVWWDNPTTVVSEIRKGRDRRAQPRYAALASHYAFEPLFCMPARGNEKPHVENRVYDLQRR